MGFNRQYFTKKECFGARLLQLAFLDVEEYACGSSAKAKFDNKMIESGCVPVNNLTTAYFNLNSKLIEKNQSLIKDLSDIEFQEQATMEELYNDFGTRYEKADLDSVDGYFKLLKKKGAQ